MWSRNEFRRLWSKGFGGKGIQEPGPHHKYAAEATVFLRALRESEVILGPVTLG